MSITRPTPAERALLVRALDGGDARHRREAVELVARHRHSAPGVVEAVRRRTRDIDLGVRHAADSALLALAR